MISGRQQLLTQGIGANAPSVTRVLIRSLGVGAINNTWHLCCLDFTRGYFKCALLHRYLITNRAQNNSLHQARQLQV